LIISKRLRMKTITTMCIYRKWGSWEWGRVKAGKVS
jgi:hypothetical protein